MNHWSDYFSVFVFGILFIYLIFILMYSVFRSLNKKIITYTIFYVILCMLLIFYFTDFKIINRFKVIDGSIKINDEMYLYKICYEDSISNMSLIGNRTVFSIKEDRDYVYDVNAEMFARTYIMKKGTIKKVEDINAIVLNYKNVTYFNNNFYIDGKEVTEYNIIERILEIENKI